MDAKQILRSKLEEHARTLWGLRDDGYVESVVGKWMEDADNPNSTYMFGLLDRYLPGRKRVLDMASGCGNGVFYALLNGHDAHGIDPDLWKRDFLGLKIREKGYPPEWLDRFHVGRGEELPFPDGAFDCVTSWQTLEHVADPGRCIAEMIRVTRPGGVVYMHCPDYRSTYEPHYRLPWLPLFPKPPARAYLRILGRPVAGLADINYTTWGKVRRWVEAGCAELGRAAQVVDITRTRYMARLAERRMTALSFAYPAFVCCRHIRSAFRCEISVDMLVRV